MDELERLLHSGLQALDHLVPPLPPEPGLAATETQSDLPAQKKIGPHPPDPLSMLQPDGSYHTTSQQRPGVLIQSASAASGQQAMASLPGQQAAEPEPPAPERLSADLPNWAYWHETFRGKREETGLE